MNRLAKRTMVTVLTVLAGIATGASGTSAQAKEVSAADGWVKAPAAGETTAAAFAVIRNPTMYDVFVTSASADIAGSVELREAVKGSGGQPVPHLTVAAYDSISMGPAGVHLLLKDLKSPLKEGDTVNLTLTTDSGTALKVAAVVRAE